MKIDLIGIERVSNGFVIKLGDNARDNGNFSFFEVYHSQEEVLERVGQFLKNKNINYNEVNGGTTLFK